MSRMVPSGTDRQDEAGGQTADVVRTCDDRGPGTEFGHPPLERCGKSVDANGEHPGGHRGEPCPDKACSAVSERTCRYPGWRMCIHPRAEEAGRG